MYGLLLSQWHLYNFRGLLFQGSVRLCSCACLFYLIVPIMVTKTEINATQSSQLPAWKSLAAGDRTLETLWCIHIVYALL